MGQEMQVVAAMIFQNSENYIELALRSIMLWADKIILVDGGCTDKTPAIVEYLRDERFVIIRKEYLKDDLGADGKQRNVYLEYLKKHHLGDWCLVIDSDEVASDSCAGLKSLCNEMDKQEINVASPHMEHFVYDLKHVDATQEKHWCPNRLFKVQEGLFYPEVEHNVLQVPNPKLANVSGITLFHLGYIKGLFSIIHRYNKNLKKSNIHSVDFLHKWKNHHILGTYPTKVYDGAYPRIMKEYFGV